MTPIDRTYSKLNTMLAHETPLTPEQIVEALRLRADDLSQAAASVIEGLIKPVSTATEA